MKNEEYINTGNFIIDILFKDGIPKSDMSVFIGRSNIGKSLFSHNELLKRQYDIRTQKKLRKKKLDSLWNISK